ncbi:MAG: hypothetical protein IT211_06750 [Armatimonadetes bacterium]|nr:hypothetical protein [Armatimonadota bacterium]
MKTLILLIILLLAACDSNSQNKEVESQSIASLKLIKQFQLEEDISLPINAIGDVSFNTSGALFSISSFGLPKAFIFSTNSGKLIKSIGTTLDFIDSIAYYQVKIWPEDKDRFHVLYSEEIKDSKGRIIPQAEIIKKTETRFSTVLFVDDSTLIAWGAITALMLEKHPSGYEKSYATLPLFCKYNIAKDEFLEIHPLTFGRSDIFPSCTMQGLCFDKEKNQVTAAIYDDESKRMNDTIRILAKFDGTGQAIRKLWLPFPQEHIKSSLGANFLNVKSTIIGSHQFTIFKTVPKIYNIEMQNFFPLSQMPKGNRMLFSLSLKDSKIPDEAIVSMIDFRMDGIYKCDNDIVVTGNYKSDGDQSLISFVQRYDIEGNLKSMYETKDDAIKFIGFSEADKSIVLFRLDRDTGWNVAYYQIQ